MSQPYVLLTNDDGVFADGIQIFRRALAEFIRVVVVAPLHEKSASGRSLTLNHPLRVGSVGLDQHYVDGTPTDCMHIALKHLLAKDLPTLVLSGINRGANLGQDVHYSGTVAAAMEATNHGINAVAFSEVAHPTFQRNEEIYSFEASAQWACRIVKALLPLTKRIGVTLNCNIPNHDVENLREVVLTSLGTVRYGQDIVERRDPRGKEYYWIGGSNISYGEQPGTDTHAVSSNRVSITPLGSDLTCAHLFDELQFLGQV